MPDDQPHPGANEEAVVRLLRHLFRGYCDEHQVPPDKRGLVPPQALCAWFLANRPAMDPDAVLAGAGVGRETWDFLNEILDSGQGPERLYHVWFMVALADKPAPAHTLERLSVVLLLTWADGTVLPVQVFASKEMVEGPGGFSDALAAAIVAKNAHTFTNAIVEDGLDGLYNRGKNYRGGTPEDPFDVFVGLVLKFLPQVRPELQPLVSDYMRLAQGMIRPVVPSEVRAQLRARRQAQGQVRGGWDA